MGDEKIASHILDDGDVDKMRARHKGEKEEWEKLSPEEKKRRLEISEEVVRDWQRGG